MAVALTHTTVATGTDAGNAQIGKTQWNETHTLTMATNRLLGRTTAGSGAVEEISTGAGLTFSAGTLDVASVNLATGVTGTLPVSNGGTGVTTLTGIVKGNGTSAFTAAVAGTDYVVPSALSSYAPLASPTFTGTIQGDFSNSTIPNRLTFQTSTTNGSTGIYALPNGTSTASSWQAANNSDPTNASKILIATNGSTDVQLVSGINGTGSYLPLSIWNGGAGRFVIGTSGQFGVGPTATVSYGTSGQAFISGGAAAAPSWGTLGVAGGGTGATTLTGILKGNGTSAFTAATANTDYVTSTGADGAFTRWMFQDTGWDWFDQADTNTAGTATLNYTNGSVQRWAPTGTRTLATSNWPPSGNLGELLIEGVNLGAATITWPTINWILPNGTTTTTFGSNGVTLQTSGTDWVFLWTRDAGTTIYGKVVR